MKKLKIILVVWVSISLIAAVWAIGLDDVKPEEQVKQVQPKAKVETRKEFLSKHFNLWTGSHRGLERVVIDSMNDPDSYEHINTDFWDHKTYLILNMTFTGKNAFGGRVKQIVKAKVDLKGNVLRILN